MSVASSRMRSSSCLTLPTLLSSRLMLFLMAVSRSSSEVETCRHSHRLKGRRRRGAHVRGKLDSSALHKPGSIVQHVRMSAISRQVVMA